MTTTLEQLGFVYPVITRHQAFDAGVPLPIAAALLMQESGGGHNVFGHDTGKPFAGAGEVTKAKYLAYRDIRGSHGQGGMQGVGPMQLTYYSYQDAADKLGGCWLPHCNMQVGFEAIANQYTHYGNWYRAFQAYNGGPGNTRTDYADSVSVMAVKYWDVV